MPEDQIITSDAESDGFSSAVAAFAKDEEPPAQAVAQPNAAPEGDQPPAPEPEPETAEPEKAAAAEVQPEKPAEFVEFTTEAQRKRFNDVFGYAKRLERELQTLRQAPPPQPVVQKPEPVAQPSSFAEPKPKLADFETADAWGDAVTEWSARKAEHTVLSLVRQQNQQEQTQRQQQEEQARVAHYINGRINEGYQKFGRHEFDNVCADLVNFAPHGSTMYHTLFGLAHYPEVSMYLGKNLAEADRISNLLPHDQIYELKDLEKKLIAKAALATKTQPKLPTKVEAPGQGEDPKPASYSLSKLRQAAKASGSLQDYQKLFMADPTL